MKNLMIEHGITQTELADGIGFSQRAVSKWVNEQSEPTETVIERVAQYFSISADYLLGLSDEEDGIAFEFPSPQISGDEMDVLSLYRGLTPARKEDLKIFLRALSGADASSASKKKA